MIMTHVDFLIPFFWISLVLGRGVQPFQCDAALIDFFTHTHRELRGSILLPGATGASICETLETVFTPLTLFTDAKREGACFHAGRDSGTGLG